MCTVLSSWENFFMSKKDVTEILTCIGAGPRGQGSQWPLHFSDWGHGPSTFLTVLF